jgi:hypothetical protein
MLKRLSFVFALIAVAVVSSVATMTVRPMAAQGAAGKISVGIVCVAGTAVSSQPQITGTPFAVMKINAANPGCKNGDEYTVFARQ